MQLYGIWGRLALLEEEVSTERNFLWERGPLPVSSFPSVSTRKHRYMETNSYRQHTRVPENAPSQRQPKELQKNMNLLGNQDMGVVAQTDVIVSKETGRKETELSVEGGNKLIRPGEAHLDAIDSLFRSGFHFKLYVCQ